MGVNIESVVERCPWWHDDNMACYDMMSHTLTTECKDCKGTGFTLTEAGRALWTLFKAME